MEPNSQLVCICCHNTTQLQRAKITRSCEFTMNDMVALSLSLSMEPVSQLVCICCHRTPRSEQNSPAAVTPQRHSWRFSVNPSVFVCAYDLTWN